jgi:hypothetical protein
VLLTETAMGRERIIRTTLDKSWQSLLHGGRGVRRHTLWSALQDHQKRTSV